MKKDRELLKRVEQLEEELRELMAFATYLEASLSGTGAMLSALPVYQRHSKDN